MSEPTYCVVLIRGTARARKQKPDSVYTTLFAHPQREYCVDFQKLYNKALKLAKRQAEHAVERRARILDRAAPAFKNYAYRDYAKAQDDWLNLRKGELPDDLWPKIGKGAVDVRG